MPQHRDLPPSGLPGTEGEEFPLVRSRVTNIYRKSLDRGYLLFVFFLSVIGLVFGSTDLVSSKSILAKFAQYCFDQNMRISKARHGLLAVQSRYAHLRGRIGRAWDCIKSWQDQLPLRNRLPISLDIVLAMVVACFNLGREGGAGAAFLVSFSVLLRVGFFGLMRPASSSSSHEATCFFCTPVLRLLGWAAPRTAELRAELSS